MLLGGHLFELQNVVVVIRPDDDQVAEEVAAVLLHRIYDSLVEVALDVEHEAAPLGIRHRGVVVVVDAGDGLQHGINDPGGFAGTNGAERDEVREKGLLIERHAP